MPVTLMPLPYTEDALAPAISAETLSFHHGKHHKAYVDKTNELAKNANASLEEIIAAARQDDRKLFNNAAQTWNHGFYWHSLSPISSGPSGDLALAIDRDLGGIEKLSAELVARGTGHFASGWVWLAAAGGVLSIEETHDGDTLGDQGKLPLLTIDVWEHAYYIDHRNARPKYLEAVTASLLNWDFASENLARGERWTYPG